MATGVEFVYHSTHKPCAPQPSPLLQQQPQPQQPFQQQQAPATPQSVTCHQLLSEKRMLFAALSDGHIAVWRRRHDVSQGHVDSKPQLLAGHTGVVRCLLLAEQEGIGLEGSLLFSGGSDRTIRMWDPAIKEAKKACVQTLRAHGGTVTSLAFCDGVLVSTSTDKTIQVWKADEGRQLLLYPWFSPHQRLDDLDCWANDTALRMGESAGLYVGDEQGTLSVYRVGTSPLQLTRWRRQPKAHALGITRLLLVAQEHLLVTLSYDNTARLFDTQSGTVVLTIENMNKCRFSALWWDHAHQELLLGDEAGFVYLWNVAAERCLKCQRLHERGAGANKAATAVRDLSVSGGEMVVSRADGCDYWMLLREVSYSEAKGHTGAVIALGVHEAGGESGGGGGGGEEDVLYSASLDNTIRAWQPYDMSTLAVLHETGSEISCLLHSPLCAFLLTGNDDGTIRLWNPDSGSTITLTGHTNTVTCLDVVVRGRADLLLSAGFDGHVGVWDISKRRHSMPRLEAMFRAHVQEVLCLKANPRKGTFVTAGNDKRVRVWSLASYEQLASLEGHTEAVSCLALDANFLLSGSEDGTVRVWDMHSYMALGKIAAHEAPVEGMLIAPECGYLVTCSTDNTVRVWDYGAGAELKCWRHPEEFRCVALKRSTGHVVAGTDQHSIVSFPLFEVVAEQKALKERMAREAREKAEREAAEAAAAEEERLRQEAAAEEERLRLEAAANAEEDSDEDEGPRGKKKGGRR